MLNIENKIFYGTDVMYAHLESTDYSSISKPKKMVSAFREIEDALSALNGAYADNTLRCYTFDLKKFWEWCEARGLPCMPSEAEVLVSFILDIKQVLRPATIGRNIAAIARAHRLLGYGDPTKDETVRLALRRMHREKGRRQKQALGMTAVIRDALLAAAGDSLMGLRDRLLVSVAYDTMRRSAELVALEFENITPVPEGGAVILVTRSKTDQEGEGKLAYISPRTMALIIEWTDRTGIRDGHLLRSVRKNGSEKGSLYSGSVGRIIKKLAASAGLPDETVKGLSGHSGRVGAAQDMAAAGIDIIAIMQADGWKSPDMVGRYVENLDVLRGGSYRLAMMQGR